MTKSNPRDNILFPSKDPSGNPGWDALREIADEANGTGGLAHVQFSDVTGKTWFWIGYTLIPYLLLLDEFARRAEDPETRTPLSNLKLFGIDTSAKQFVRIESHEDVIVTIAQNMPIAFYAPEPAPTQEAMVDMQMRWHDRMKRTFESLAAEAQARAMSSLPTVGRDPAWGEIHAAADDLAADNAFVLVQGPRLIGTPLVWAGYAVIQPTFLIAEFAARILNPKRRTPLFDIELLAIDTIATRATRIESAQDVIRALYREHAIAVYMPGPVATRRAMSTIQNATMLQVLRRIRAMISSIKAGAA